MKGTQLRTQKAKQNQGEGLGEEGLNGRESFDPKRQTASKRAGEGRRLDREGCFGPTRGNGTKRGVGGGRLEREVEFGPNTADKIEAGGLAGKNSGPPKKNKIKVRD